LSQKLGHSFDPGIFRLWRTKGGKVTGQKERPFLQAFYLTQLNRQDWQFTALISSKAKNKKSKPVLSDLW
jgi:hypothetical protein